MKKYDPFTSPDPDEWLEMDESRRIEMVLQYHRKARIEMPNERIHAAIHVAVENQIAMGDEISVHETLVRMMSEGLDRHDAVHAIATVLSEIIYASSKGEPVGDPNATYFSKLRTLTAQGWLEEWEQS